MFSRVVYAASPAEPVDDVAAAMTRMLTAEELTVIGSTHENMLHLGVPPELER